MNGMNPQITQIRRIALLRIAPKGRKMIAQGEALGRERQATEALKGRHNLTLCEGETAMESIEVRRVTQNDAVFLQQLMNNDQIMAILHEVPRSVDVWADAIVGWDNDPDEEDYIVLDEGMPIGWLGINGLSSESKQVFMKMMALLPTHQGRGIGQRVVKEMIENLRLRGFASLELYTDVGNVRAQHCYRRCGFNISEKTVQKMSDGTIVDRCRMKLSL